MGCNCSKNKTDSLNELIEKNDGSPAFAPDEKRDKIIFRVKLTYPFALFDAKNEKICDLVRLLYLECRTSFVFKSINGKRKFRIYIFGTEALTDECLGKGIKYVGTVQIRTSVGEYTKMTDIYR